MGSGSSRSSENGSVKNLKLSKKDLQYFLKEVKEHISGINSMCITPDGSMLVSGSEDHTARIFDTEREETVSVLKGHDSYINFVTCNSNYVFTAAADKCIRKWRIDTGVCTRTMKGHTGAVNRLVLVKNILFSSSYDRSVKCWHVDTGECLATLYKNGHQLGIYPLLYIPSQENTFERDYANLSTNTDILVSGSADSTAKSWDLRSKDVINTFRGHTAAVLSLATDKKGVILFTGSQDATIRSFDLQTGEAIKVFRGHLAAVLQLQVVNRLLFSGSCDHTVRCWITEYADCTRVYKGHEHTIGCMTVINGILLTGSGDNTARAYDAKSGACKRVFRGHTGTINAIIKRGDKLYTASYDGTIRIWDAAKLKGGDDIITENGSPNSNLYTDENSLTQ